MSCGHCEGELAGGAQKCAYCGQDLEHWRKAEPDDTSSEPVDDVVPPPQAVDVAHAETTPPEGSSTQRVLVFIGGFVLALVLMGIGASFGLAGNIIGALIGAIGLPVGMVVMAKVSGNRPLAAGGITALAVVVIVFGGCVMLLSGAKF